MRVTKSGLKGLIVSSFIHPPNSMTRIEKAVSKQCVFEAAFLRISDIFT
jgi:hypothetical protein